MSSPGNSEDAVHRIAKGVSSSIGETFFRSLVENVAQVLDADQVYIAELDAGLRHGETIAVWSNGGIAENFTVDVAVRQSQNPDGSSEMVLKDASGEAIGLFAIVFKNPLRRHEQTEYTLQMLSPRAAGEIEHRRKERQLTGNTEQLTKDLAAVHREIESFSYSMSHDLRAPLRNISGFVELLKQDSSPLTADAHLYLETITQEAGRMSLLVDSLLEFSRIGRTKMSVQTVETQGLMQEVLKGFELETKGRSMQWKIGILPSVQADLLLLRQVFENLISNAVKSTRKREHALIEVDWKREESAKEIIFFVRDNGEGFDMKYVGKLFGVFQKLHSVKEFPGIGIGLAIVQRIVHRHGGTIWAEAAVNQGATFYFSLPA